MSVHHVFDDDDSDNSVMRDKNKNKMKKKKKKTFHIKVTREKIEEKKKKVLLKNVDMKQSTRMCVYVCVGKTRLIGQTFM